MHFLAGTKNSTLYVAPIPHAQIDEQDRELLIRFFSTFGASDIQILTTDPRGDLFDTVSSFPEAQDMAVLPLAQPFVWRCPKCQGVSPRWTETRGPECCSGRTFKDVTLSGLPWEN